MQHHSVDRIVICAGNGVHAGYAGGVSGQAVVAGLSGVTLVSVEERSGVDRAVLIAKLSVGVVFAWNVQCAIRFLMEPGSYAPGLELSGVTGQAVVQAVGILFLMWNVTYLPVLVDPRIHRTIFAVVLVQQVIGLVGESVLSYSLPPGHEVLMGSLARFIASDAIGLVLMGAAYVYLRVSDARARCDSE